MFETIESAADEMRERVEVLRSQAERNRAEAARLDEEAIKFRTLAERSDRIADEYAAVLPPRTLAEVIEASH